MNFKTKSVVATLVLAFTLVATGQATPIQPVSYEMYNGQSGTYTYYDDSYTGIGSRTTSLSYLSGGLGDLTDGIVATTSWFTDSAGAYVGWSRNNPIITFHFGSSVDIDSLTLYVADANGLGGVAMPGSVSVNGDNFTLTDPSGSGPLAVTISELGFSGSVLELELFDGAAPWIFLSEIEFDSRSLQVAEPATLILLGLGMFGMAAGRRRRN